jgi:enoyl-CoA hydratase/carnithine racemase
MEIAQSIAGSVSPIAAKTAKRQLYAELMSLDVGRSVEDSKVLIGQLMKQPDFSEALASMKEKRVPVFKGL